MAYQVLETTPFGFVIELINEDSYFTKTYELTVNGQSHGQRNTNIIELFGLKPATTYQVVLSGDLSTLSLSLETASLGFLIDIRDYHSGGEDWTAAIQGAIYTAPKGATVYVPAGNYQVSHLFLKSKVDIYLEKGAVIYQNPDRTQLGILKGYQKNYDHTDVTLNASWEGHPLDCYTSLIYGKDVKKIHIYGEGTIDGSGEESGFWENPKVRNVAYRPRNLTLVNCEKVRITGITSRNSAAWNIHPVYSEKITFTAVKIQSHEHSPNTDGLNPESCTEVSIIGCHFSVGDDCIAIKSGKYYMNQYHYQPTKNLTIRNCFMEKGHGGVVIGSEIACGVENVTVSNCYFKDTDRGLRIKTRRGRGKLSVVDGITFKNVTMEKVEHGFVINMFYFCDPDGKTLYVRDKTITQMDDMTPTVRNIVVDRVKATGIRGCGIFIYGLPENPVTGIEVRASTFDFAPNREVVEPAMMEDLEDLPKDIGIYIKHGQVSMENNTVIGDYSEVMDGTH